MLLALLGVAGLTVAKAGLSRLLRRWRPTQRVAPAVEFAMDVLLPTQLAGTGLGLGLLLHHLFSEL